MVETALNAHLQLVRMPLAEAGLEVRMVESLQPMWDEEKLRIGDSPPPPPPEPTRTAKPLCQHIEVVRAQLQVCVLQCCYKQVCEPLSKSQLWIVYSKENGAISRFALVLAKVLLSACPHNKLACSCCCCTTSTAHRAGRPCMYLQSEAQLARLCHGTTVTWGYRPLWMSTVQRRHSSRQHSLLSRLALLADWTLPLNKQPRSHRAALPPHLALLLLLQQTCLLLPPPPLLLWQLRLQLQQQLRLQLRLCLLACCVTHRQPTC